jgi:hypothetical protein
MQADADGCAYAGVFTPRLRFGFGASYGVRRLPCLFEWRVRRAGTYVLGLEPSRADLHGRAGARAAGTLTMLEPGESVAYRLTFRAARRANLAAAQSAWSDPAPDGRCDG